MENFGRKVRALRKRKQLKGPSVAAQALGEASSTKQRKSFANYLSRIERGKMDNPSLDLLERLASGLGFKKLWEFFAEIEGGINKDLQLASPNTDNAALATLTPGVEHGPIQDPAIQSGAPFLIIREDHLERLGDRVAAIMLAAGRVTVHDRPTASTRPRRRKDETVRRRRRAANS